MSGFVIRVGHQGHGTTFQLHPKSQIFLEERFPEAEPVVSVYLSFPSEQDLSLIPDATWLHVAQLLTSLTEGEIADLGGFEVVMPPSGPLVYRSQQSHAA